MRHLRPYQKKLEAEVLTAWAQGAKNVLKVAATGSGKTVMFASLINKNVGPTCVIAHRQELVMQNSVALALNGVRHRIIGSQQVVKLCVAAHMRECGRSLYHPSAACAVAGVDTLIRRNDQLKAWRHSVTLWVIDEGHHVLKENKWGTATEMFPNARGLGGTATPRRADGKGLGAHADGVFHTMVVGPGSRELISAGYLCDYRLFEPPSDLDLSSVPVGSTGDYGQQKLKVAVRKSHIVGDISAHYRRIARGKLGVTFSTDIDTAKDITAQYTADGIRAAILTGKTPAQERVSTLHQFKFGQLDQLVNVDLFGEGFDLPAIEVVSLGRPTQSFSVFVQQFGRALRLNLTADVLENFDSLTDRGRRAIIAASSKPYAIVIDHVGARQRHGLPDAPQVWTLDRRESRKASAPPDVISVRVCVACTGVYPKLKKACPYCGHVHVPAQRETPAQVDGDLIELSPEALARLRGEVALVDRSPEEYRGELAGKCVPLIGQLAGVKRHVGNQTAQARLRSAIALWGGYQRYYGRSDGESYRSFYYIFGIDVLSAQTLKAKEADVLTRKLEESLNEFRSMGDILGRRSGSTQPSTGAFGSN